MLKIKYIYILNCKSISQFDCIFLYFLLNKGSVFVTLFLNTENGSFKSTIVDLNASDLQHRFFYLDDKT